MTVTEYFNRIVAAISVVAAMAVIISMMAYSDPTIGHAVSGVILLTCITVLFTMTFLGCWDDDAHSDDEPLTFTQEELQKIVEERVEHVEEGLEAIWTTRIWGMTTFLTSRELLGESNPGFLNEEKARKYYLHIEHEVTKERRSKKDCTCRKCVAEHVWNALDNINAQSQEPPDDSPRH